MKKNKFLLVIVIGLLMCKCSLKEDYIEIFNPKNQSLNFVKSHYKRVKGVDIPIYSKNFESYQEGYVLDYKKAEIRSKKWVFDNVEKTNIGIDKFIKENKFEKLCSMDSEKILIYSPRYRHIYILTFHNSKYLTVHSKW